MCSGGVENVQSAVAEAGLTDLAPCWLLLEAAANRGTHGCQETPEASYSGKKFLSAAIELASGNSSAQQQGASAGAHQ